MIKTHKTKNIILTQRITTMQHNGQLTISRITSNTNTETINIELTDKNTAKRIAKINITPEQLTLALTAKAEQPCTYTLTSLDYIGKQKETKTITLQSQTNTPNDEQIQQWTDMITLTGWEIATHTLKPKSAWHKKGTHYEGTFTIHKYTTPNQNKETT